MTVPEAIAYGILAIAGIMIVITSLWGIHAAYRAPKPPKLRPPSGGVHITRR